MSKRLCVQHSHDGAPVKSVVVQLSGDLKSIGEVAPQRKFKANLSDFFERGIDVAETYDFLLTAIGRCIVGLACFYQTGWLPGCLPSQALHERQGFCKVCYSGSELRGRAFRN